MTAYVVFIKDKTLDQKELDIYAEKVPALLTSLQATVLAAYGHMEVFEGPAPEGAVLVSFPTLQQAKDWYYGEAYQSVVKHRHQGAIYRGFVLEGITP